MKKILLSIALVGVVAVLLSSCNGRGYCYCESYSPYVDTYQMNSQADAISTAEGCAQYDSGSAGYFGCAWVNE